MALTVINTAEIPDDLPDPAPHRSDVLNYEHFDCCGQGMVPKDEATQTFCPPSAVHDMIVRWDEVCEGDLALHAGQLRSVLAMHDDGPPNRVVIVCEDAPQNAAMRIREDFPAVRR